MDIAKIHPYFVPYDQISFDSALLRKVQLLIQQNAVWHLIERVRKLYNMYIVW